MSVVYNSIRIGDICCCNVCGLCLIKAIVVQCRCTCESHGLNILSHKPLLSPSFSPAVLEPALTTSPALLDITISSQPSSVPPTITSPPISATSLPLPSLPAISLPLLPLPPDSTLQYTTDDEEGLSALTTYPEW